MRTSLIAILFALYQGQAMAAPVEAVLRLSPRVPMSQLAQDVTDPASPRYRQFYTPEEIRALAAPSDEAYAALVAKLANAGVTVVRESASHLSVTVRAEQAVFEQLFQAKIESVDAKTRRLVSEVKVPEELGPVASISGLDNTRRLHPMLRLALDPEKKSSFKGIPLTQIRTLFGFNPLYTQGLTGKGQHIAIATYDAFYIDDINQYYVQNKLNPAPVVDQITFNGTPTYSTQLSDVETAIDAQFSGALAPGAAIHIFASADNSDAGELAMFTAILDDNRAKVVNYSWGGCESDLTAQHKSDMDTVFQRAVAQGVNLLVASGDSGAYCPSSPTVVADWPAAHGSVVAVGGTHTDSTKTTLSEVAWSYDSTQGDGSGGGISTVWDLPDYQASFKAPYVKRSYPDVAFNADPASGQAGYVRITPTGQPAKAPVNFVLGGTSIAAPQWAGFLTLIGEARAKAGKPALGFLNPVIYAMSAGDQATAFDGITSGNNGAYQAGPGWNAVCGWGGLHADVLGSYLINH